MVLKTVKGEGAGTSWRGGRCGGRRGGGGGGAGTSGRRGSGGGGADASKRGGCGGGGAERPAVPTIRERVDAGARLVRYPVNVSPAVGGAPDDGLQAWPPAATRQQGKTNTHAEAVGLQQLVACLLLAEGQRYPSSRETELGSNFRYLDLQATPAASLAKTFQERPNATSCKPASRLGWRECYRSPLATPQMQLTHESLCMRTSRLVSAPMAASGSRGPNGSCSRRCHGRRVLDTIGNASRQRRW